MSDHADTFRNLKIVGIVQTTEPDEGYVDGVVVSPELRDTLLAENQRLREALELLNGASADLSSWALAVVSDALAAVREENER